MAGKVDGAPLSRRLYYTLHFKEYQEIIGLFGQCMSLHQGILISRGTPPGVGMGEKPNANLL